MADSRPFLPSLAATANDAILNDILQTVQLKEAHLATGRNQGAVWQNVLDLVFSHHMAPCRLYKPPKCKYGFKNVVVKAIETRYNMVTQRGAHSTGNPDEFEDVSEVNKLAILLFNEMVEEKDRAIAEKLQKEAHRAEVKAMSDAVIVPPLALPANFAQLREHYANNQKTRNPLSVLTGAAPAVSPIPGFGTATASTAVDNDDAIEIDLDGDENTPPKKVARQRLSTGDAKDLIVEFQKKDSLGGGEILGLLNRSMVYNNEMLRIAKADEERKQQAEDRKQQAEDRKRKAEDRDHFFHLWTMKEKVQSRKNNSTT